MHATRDIHQSRRPLMKCHRYPGNAAVSAGTKHVTDLYEKDDLRQKMVGTKLRLAHSVIRLPCRSLSRLNSGNCSLHGIMQKVGRGIIM